MQEGSQFDVPFDTKCILQHFDTAHKVELDILKRPSLSFQKRNPSLNRNFEVERRDQRTNIEDCGQTRAYPHLGAFDFPFITVAFVSSPFCLEEVKNRREGEVLATLGRRKQIARLLQLLLLLLWLLLNLLLLTLGLLLPRYLKRTEHWRLTVGADVAMVVVAGVCLMARVTVFDGC